MLPKVLIISNTAYNNSDANGRTLGNAFVNWPEERLISFCIKGNYISSELVKTSYRVTDYEILKAFIKKKVNATSLPYENNSELITTKSGSARLKKTALKCVVREAIWDLNLHKTDFYEIARHFEPDIVLLQLGDTSFVIKLAIQIAEQNNSKLVVFTTEDYYFKNWNYIQPDKNNLTFSFLQHHYKKTVKELMSRTELLIANTPMLAAQYSKEFNIKTEILMQCASYFEETSCSRSDNTVIYAGNLGLNRHLSLVDIAHTMLLLDSSIKIEVYSGTSQDDVSELLTLDNIAYMGFKDYEYIKRQMQQARLILHMESFDDFYRRDLVSAFSTKISDALACGVPLFLYAPDNLAETLFLKENDAAFICNEKSSLLETLNVALYDIERRNTIVNNAKQVVRNKHNAESNREKIKTFLLNVNNK